MAKARAAKKIRATTAIAAAKKIRDKRARAVYLEQQFPNVDKPVALVEPLGDALFDTVGNHGIGQTLLAIAKRTRAPLLLDAIGQELERRWCEGQAIEVLRLAIAAGSKDEATIEVLGRMLALRGDPDCVAFLERAIANDPDDDAPRIALALWFLDREPERALQAVSVVECGEAEDIRAMLHTAAGRVEAAEDAVAEALAHYDSKLDGHLELCEWHANERRYDRALFHARALVRLRPKRLAAALRDRVDEAIVHAFHRAAVFGEIESWVIERCARTVPRVIAWDVFHGLTSTTPIRHPELAIRAAELCATDVSGDAQLWRVRIASVRATDDDTSPLAALAEDGLANDAEAWVELANAYHAHGAVDAANAAVDRALQLDPSSVGALVAMFDLATHAGDLVLMERAARAVADADPHGHEGSERLGRMLLRRGEGVAALELAQQAVQIAPYCHNAWLGLGEAQLVIGDLARAREAAKRSAAISAPDSGDDTAVLLAALAGDPSALEAELVVAYRHLPALPFPPFIAALRAACARVL